MNIRQFFLPARRIAFAWMLLASLIVGLPGNTASFKVLVFTKTAAFRHSSIGPAVAAIQELGTANDFVVDSTEDPSFFTDTTLSQYDVVIFALTTGDVLNPSQQAAMERFIQAGKGFVGIHSAADTEYDWTWYGGLVGAYFKNHPSIQQANIRVLDRSHQSTSPLSERWQFTDEWYNYRTNPRGQAHVLMTIDESSYAGGSMGSDHPISWCQGYDGGRSWYTGLGHSNSTWSNASFRSHLLGGIQYAASGNARTECGATVGSSYDRNVLSSDLTAPTAIAALPDGRVLVTEKSGALKLWRPTGLATAGILAVDSASDRGLLGVAVDPNFGTNSFIYLFYSVGGTNKVSRFQLSGDSLSTGSEQAVLSVPSSSACCNIGGGLAFGPDGSLFISTGDATNADPAGYAPLDERSGRALFDAQRTSSSTDSLLGKVLRIRPSGAGGYSIPPGNLFPSDGSLGRPEIYAMGVRDPSRISIDSSNGWAYLADPGPLAVVDSASRGPRGYDEINQLKSAVNLGWPYCIGAGLAYRDYDYATGINTANYSCTVGVNDSPNNTGTTSIPPSTSSLIAYSSAADGVFGAGSRSVVAGPVYERATPPQSGAFPAYHQRTLFVADTSRGSMFEVRLDAAGAVLATSPFLDDFTWNVLDMAQGSDGSLLVLDRGSNSTDPAMPDSTLLKVTFNPTADPPIAVITPTSGTTGPSPLTVSLSGSSSRDPDPGDTLSFKWDFTSDGSIDATGPNVSYTYPAGTHKVTLEVTDSTGRSRSASLTIRSGIPASNPVANSSATAPTSGPAPLAVAFSSAGSFDPDGDQIVFAWDFTNDGVTDSDLPNPRFTYGPGQFVAKLTVTDSTGRSASSLIEIASGNTRPVVVFDTPKAFGFGRFETAIPYRIDVSDAEDGSIGQGIECSAVSVSAVLTHGGHTHQQGPIQGCEGQIQPDSGAHNPDKDTLLLTVTAVYRDRGGSQLGPIDGTHQVVIHPSRKQAESFVSQNGVSTKVLGSEAGAAAGHTVAVGINSGDWINFGPMNLGDVRAVGFRAATWFAGGTVEIRSGSLDGDLIGAVAIPTTSTTSPYVYREVVVPIASSDTVSDVYLLFKSFLPGRSVGIADASQELFSLDWVDFLRPSDPMPGLL